MYTANPQINNYHPMMSMQYYPSELQSVPVLTALDLQEVLSCSDAAYDRGTVYSPTEVQRGVDPGQYMLKEKQMTSNLMERLLQLEQQQKSMGAQQHQIKSEESMPVLNGQSRAAACQQSKRLSTGDISFLEALLSTDNNSSTSIDRPDRLELFLNELGQNDSASISTPSSPPTPTESAWSTCERDDDLLAYDDDAISSTASSPLSVSEPMFKKLLDDINGPPCDEISDNELIQLSVKELNRRLKNVDASLAQRLKQRRRLLKNRGYAQTCRSRRIKQQKSLTKQNESLVSKINSLQSRCQQLEKERNEFKKKYENLMQFVGKSN